ncbi:T9SS type A sorting domain-containing protein [Aquimarina rhabdastrellae]
MILKTLRRISFLLLWTCCIYSYAQQSTVIAGKDITGNGGTVSFSIGQQFYSHFESNTGKITEGLQQSIEVITLDNPEFTAIDLKAVVYPNPTVDKIELTLKNLELDNITYALYDIQGRFIEKAKVGQQQLQINLQNQGAGIYLLNVNQGNKKLKSFKIIKK